MNPQVLVPIADGSEEIEAVCIIDVLRRAQVDVTVARVATNEDPNLIVVASRGVLIRADVEITNCADSSYDAIVLPGGMPGAEHLRDDPTLTSLLLKHHAENRILAAICASPAVVLQHHDLIGECRATCYPSFMNDLPAKVRSSAKVVHSGNLITSRGPGTALIFAVELVGALCGEKIRDTIAEQLLLSTGR